jgi:pimeloyl-ACP methyl ester carboxylesterase
MFVHESGPAESPSIVFLHGNGANGAMWKTHMDQLTGYHCLAPDLPGFGRSQDREWVSLQETTDQLVGLIRDRLPGARVHLVGLSLGGSVAITLISQAPELIDHAIVDGAGVLPLPSLPLMKVGFRLMQPLLHTDWMIKTIAGAFKIPEEDYAEFRAGMLDMSPASFTRSILQANAMRQPPGLDTAECRVLFVAGEGEPQGVRRSGALLAKTMPNAESRIVPGMGHGWLAEAPDLHCRMVRAWIKDRALPPDLRAAHL